MDVLITVDESSPEPLHRQVYAGLRQAILSGRLSPGQRLPSTRALAERLCISRATVLLGYEQLASEGYLESFHGSGTLVCSQLPEDLTHLGHGVAAKRSTRFSGAALSPCGKRLQDRPIPWFAEGGLPYDFRNGSPDLDMFPREIWNRLLTRYIRASDRSLLDYEADPRGHEPLREAIAAHLRQARAVVCDAGRVIILNGTQQALDLAARALLGPGDTVAIEDPGYPGASYGLSIHGARLLPLPVVDGALSLDPLKRASRCRLIYVTPSHQYPTGIVMSLSQRLELLERSLRCGARIFEDDYDSEFRYAGRPLPSLQGLDSRGLVLYAGTFSKTMFPALRVGYLVAPADLVDVIARARWAADRQTHMLEQCALNDFIREGHLDRHIRRMRVRYGRRREALMEELERHFRDRATLWGESAGLHLMVRFRTRLEDAELIRRAAGLGVGLESAAGCRIAGRSSGEFLLRFGCMDEATIREGLRRLASVLDSR